MSQRPTFWETVIFLVLFVVVVLGAKIIHAKLVYDDVRCAFADCRITVEAK